MSLSGRYGLDRLLETGGGDAHDHDDGHSTTVPQMITGTAVQLEPEIEMACSSFYIPIDLASTVPLYSDGRDLQDCF